MIMAIEVGNLRIIKMLNYCTDACRRRFLSFFSMCVAGPNMWKEAPHGHPHLLNFPIDPETCLYIAQAFKKDSSAFSAPLKTQLRMAFILYKF